MSRAGEAQPSRAPKGRRAAIAGRPRRAVSYLYALQGDRMRRAGGMSRAGEAELKAR